MKLAVFPKPDTKNSTLIKRVYQKSKGIIVVDQKNNGSTETSKAVTVEEIEGKTVAVDGHSMSSLSEPPSGTTVAPQGQQPNLLQLKMPMQ